jgi:glucan phosphoethanolaminetransferase (alkaline phosphatase superfamily)
MLAWIAVLMSNAHSFTTNVHALPGEIFTAFTGMIVSSITALVLGVLIFFPLEFRPYAVLCCIWGLMNLIDGGSTSGLLMYMLGLTFAYHAKFFEKHIEIKSIFVSLLPLLGIISQARFGIDKLLLSVMDFVALALISGLVFMLFLPNIRKNRKKTAISTNIAYLPAETFSERDIRILNKVQAGEKYESIAKEEDIGLSTLKNKMKTIFNSLDVDDKTSFMSTYAGYTILLKYNSSANSQD